MSVLPRRAARPARGFSLVELLCVLAITAILAALVTPLFVHARERSHRAACLSNLRQLADAFSTYSSDWDDVYPPHVPPGELPDSPAGDPWDRRMAAYVHDDRLFVCPSNAEGTFSYAYNAWIAQPERYAGAYRLHPERFEARALADMTDPSDTILLFDVSNPDPDLRGMIGEHDVWGQTLQQMVEGADPGDRDLVEDWELDRLRRRGEAIPDWALPRHARGSNFAYVDGHAIWSRRLERDGHLPPS